METLNLHDKPNVLPKDLTPEELSRNWYMFSEWCYCSGLECPAVTVKESTLFELSNCFDVEYKHYEKDTCAAHRTKK